jgi:transloator
MSIAAVATAPPTSKAGPVENIDANQQVTAPGVADQAGPVPGVNPAQPGSTAIIAGMMAVILESLAEVMPDISTEDLDARLAEAIATLKKTEDASNKEGIEVQSQAKRAALADKLAKLQESLKKLNEAIAKREDGSFWDGLTDVLKAVAAVLAVVLVCTGVGAPLGGLMIAALVIMCLQTVDDITQKLTGHGIAGNIAGAFGGNPDDWDTGFRIALAAAAVVVAVLTIWCNPGAAGTAVDAAKTAGSTAQAAEAADAGAKTAAQVKTFAQGAQSVAQVGAATSSTVSGVYSYQATTLNADAKRLQAQASQQQALMQLLDQYIDMAIARLTAASNRNSDMLASLAETMRDHARTMDHVRIGTA